MKNAKSRSNKYAETPQIFFLNKIEENFPKKSPKFGGGDGPSNRFFEEALIFSNFLRLDSGRTSRALQFES